ncbi:MAG TPA: NAD(P)/FAD-dependent oxidoreductase [Rhodothermales bacterium]
MFDAIVVGAGPGGATAAHYMGRAGLKVLLVDRAGFPRDKVCGDAISRKATAMLPELGISSLEGLDDCMPSYGVRLAGDRGDPLSLTFKEEYDRGAPPSYVCTRRSFDRLLVDRAVAAGATFWPYARVDELLRQGDQVNGVRLTRLQGNGSGEPGDRFPRSEAVNARVVVGADGTYSVVARELRMPQLDDRHYCAGIRAYFRNVATEDPLHHLEVYFLEQVMPGYFWVSPLPGGRANVGVSMLSHTVKKRGIQLKDVLVECLQHPRIRDRFANAEMEGVTKGWGLPLGSKPRRMAGDGWMLVGDAASLVDPFAGEGIGNAMLSGRLAAETVVRAAESQRGSYDVLKAYPKSVMNALKGDLRLSYRLQRLGNWKWLLNGVIQKGSRSQDLTRVMTGMFNDGHHARRLLSPLFYVRVLTA